MIFSGGIDSQIFYAMQCWKKRGVLMEKMIERPTLISMCRGSNPGLVIGIFLQSFFISGTLAPSGPSIGESTFHYHQSGWLTCLIQLCHEMPVCEYVVKARWLGMVGRKRASDPLLSIILVFPLKFPRMLKPIGGVLVHRVT
jgi:hypothetical protein